MLKRVENNGMVLKAKNDVSGRKYGETSGPPGQTRTVDLLIRSQMDDLSQMIYYQ